MKRRETPFALLSLAVILPLLMLAVLAWKGMAIQAQRVRAAASEEARASADRLVFQITTELEARFRTAAIFPDPPPPGPPAKPDDALAGDHLPEIRFVRDDESEGLSPGGLPRRVLAALRVAEATRKETDALEAIRLAAEVLPSAISPKVFQRVNEWFPGLADAAIRDWQRGYEARELVRQDPKIDPLGEWRSSLLLEVASSGVRSTAYTGSWPQPEPTKTPFTAIRFFDYADLLEAIHKVVDVSPNRGIPAWAAVRITKDREVIHGPPASSVEEHTIGRLVSFQYGGETMASLPILFGPRLQLDIIAIRPSAYLEAARIQSQWTIALMLMAVAGAAGGLWVIRRVYERERKLNALKSDFVASVSHELRAPIASIRLMADALEEGKIEQGTAHEFHRLISREGARLSTLIENVLDFARIEQGKKQWRLEETDLRALLMDTVALMEPLAQEKDIHLHVEVPETATATLDADAIRQALVNLLDNAIKFSPPGSGVKVVLSEYPDTIRIAIADEGPGIPQKEHGRIFEKFHRLGGELRRETQGTGIGLSLVTAIAEAHSGRVDLESEPGKGSTFILILPKS